MSITNDLLNYWANKPNGELTGPEAVAFYCEHPEFTGTPRYASMNVYRILQSNRMGTTQAISPMSGQKVIGHILPSAEIRKRKDEISLVEVKETLSCPPSEQHYQVTVFSNGTRTWWDQSGKKRHRVEGPAYEQTNGYQVWYNHGKIHRIGGPALLIGDGTEKWFQNDNLHREDGPAVIYPDGECEYWLHDEKFTKEEFDKKMNPEPSCDGKIVEIDGKKYKLTEVV